MPITEQEARELAHETLTRKMLARTGQYTLLANPGQVAYALTGILAALVNIEHHLQQISAGLGLLLENK